MSAAKPARRAVRTRRKPKAATRRPSTRTRAFPPIGSEWQGGIYAGVARGRDGAPDYHLIVLTETEPLTWDEAMKRGELPFRKEQALCFANVPELFQPVSYWSCEQHASYSVCAWSQDFYDGSQLYWFKTLMLRARFVRRLPL